MNQAMNSYDQFTAARRALIFGALVGGTTACVRHWSAYQQGDININQLVAQSARGALRAGLISGGTTAVASLMSERPLLSLVTVLSAGAAGLYLYDELRGSRDEKA